MSWPRSPNRTRRARAAAAKAKARRGTRRDHDTHNTTNECETIDSFLIEHQTSPCLLYHAPCRSSLPPQQAASPGRIGPLGRLGHLGRLHAPLPVLLPLHAICQIFQSKYEIPKVGLLERIQPCRDVETFVTHRRQRLLLLVQLAAEPRKLRLEKLPADHHLGDEHPLSLILRVTELLERLDVTPQHFLLGFNPPDLSCQCHKGRKHLGVVLGRIVHPHGVFA
ncbi:hypothetical protein CTA2_7478 [Colletotrichum tanaceti]|uniref:Uncharacterized protein n=1 Tax=Colletotrichum tanaceti TaxID=1306861 RepID=A0A4U6X1K1_9PEZI|nr:hypothetical protein CTA2_7478 [Colletotrichum tanaceti]TKW49241.1 hypothetical protein CTA1_9880 [Colletotrichum tanaceti]